MRAKKTAGNLRIIGGTWRGRKLPVVEQPGLRPTTDRIRETLFNWLAPELPGCHCLDLFAGTGALGLEALSRGAASCHFVELQRSAADTLSQTLQLLDARDRAEVRHGDALELLQTNPRRIASPGSHVPGAATDLATGQGTRGNSAEKKTGYDLVFLDPPFADGLLNRAMQLLAGSDLLAEDALVYAEYAVQQEVEIPAQWTPWRSKRSSAVAYELYRREKGV